MSSGGPGLMFIYLVNIMNNMAGGRIIEVIFYLCVLFAGVSSIINLYEAPVAFLQEKFKANRVTATAIIHIIGCIVAICIQGIVSQWMDVVSIYILSIRSIACCYYVFLGCRKRICRRSCQYWSKQKIGNWFYPAGKYVYCLLALVALIAGALLGGIG